MANVSIRKIRGVDIVSLPLFDEVQNLYEAIKQRAYDLFQSRGSGDGRDFEDWIEAERQVLWSPQAELLERPTTFELRVAVPGFGAEDVDVTALPDSIIVQAENFHRHEREDGELHLCEFSDKKLFRRIDLPSSIDVDGIVARLDRGILEITAPKAGRQRERKITVAEP